MSKKKPSTITLNSKRLNLSQQKTGEKLNASTRRLTAQKEENPKLTF